MPGVACRAWHAGCGVNQACGYFDSSGDLARGVDVTVYPMQALPDALVRELTLARKAGASGPLTNPWAEVEFN